ncbi:MAG: hypothetical protein ACTHM8_02300 [Sphingomonas sp.]
MTSTDTNSHNGRDAVKRAGDAMEANPLAVLAGGAAVGLLAGLAIPRSRKETELLGPVGKRMTAAATAAASAARDTGFAELEAHGISGKAAKAQINRLFEGVVEAAGTAGQAAASAAAEKAKKPAK